MNNPPVRKLWPIGPGQALFWSWNCLFFLVSAFGVLPLVVTVPAFVWREAFGGEILLRIGLFLCLPAACMVYAWKKLKGSPRGLMRLFYGVEVPLLVLMSVRTFALEDWSRGGVALVAAALIAMAALAWELGYGLRTPAWLLAGRTTGVLLALWMAALLVLYVPPLVHLISVALRQVHLLADLTRAARGNEWQLVLALMLFAPFWLFSATLLVAMPFGLVWAHLDGFRRVFRHHALRTSPKHTRIVCLAAAGLFLVGTTWANRQTPLWDGAIAELQSSELRRVLVDGYLASHRYLFAEGEDRHLRRMYEPFAGTTIAEAVQAVQHTLGTPFVYDAHDFASAQARARELYEARFDTPIERGERALIAEIVAKRRIWQRSREATLLDVDSKRVMLARQDVNIDEHGAWAEIEIHDTYQNQTDEEQEIGYYFSLPEDAAITGLWLGSTANRDQRYAGVIAPRGAAERVYTAQVRRNIDPALVEQMGPTQYRLRAYPVPPPPAELHLWLSYVTLREGADWPRPHVVEKRNAYWPGDRDGWVTNELVAQSSRASALETAVLGDRTVVVREPFDPRQTPLPEGKTILIIVDQSYSMRAHASAANAVLGWARYALAEKNQVDVLWARAAKNAELEPISQTRALVAMGHETLGSLLRQAPSGYDAWIVLTDASGVEGAPGEVTPALWLVPLGDEPPQRVADETQKLLRRRGSGVAGSVERAAQRWALASADASIVAATDTSVWRERAGAKAEAAEAPTGLDRIATKHVIAARAASGHDLAHLHALASTAGVVTPYSSLIVLLTESQRAALKLASLAPNAFDRDQAPLQPPTAVSATPEPEEWALIVVALAVAILLAKRDRFPTRRFS